jgi:Ca2+/H+ antiporter, TMEM165/GDT1 family
METSERQSIDPVKEISLSLVDLELQDIDSNPKKLIKPKPGYFWPVFSSTFITIFLAEMGDKTQLVTLLMSAESQSPWTVFTGAALALVATSLIGVSIGYWLSKKLSPETLDLAVAILLLFITGWLISDIIGN